MAEIKIATGETQAKRLKEAERLIGLALDFWSAPGIDMPDIDTFDGMTKFMGKAWKCRYDEDGNYIGEGIKPVGMTAEEHDAREEQSDELRLRFQG